MVGLRPTARALGPNSNLQAMAAASDEDSSSPRAPFLAL
jgi:hypothetical protein